MSQDSEQKPLLASSWSKTLPVFIIGVLSVALSIFAFSSIVRSEKDTLEQRFHYNAQNHSSFLQQNFNLNTQIITSLRGYFNASDYVTREEFTIFSDQLIFEHTDIMALEWVPYVAVENRAKLEKEARANGYQDFTIKPYSPEDSDAVDEGRDFYFPIFYINPESDNQHLLGRDLASSPKRYQAIMKSWKTGEIVASEPVPMAQEGQDGYGTLVFVPVSKKAHVGGSDNKSLKGFAVGVLNVGEMVESIFSQMLNLEGFNIYFFDTTHSHDPIFLYFHSYHHDGREKQVKTAVLDNLQQGLYHKTTLNLADREWTAILVSDHKKYTSSISIYAWMVLIGGIVISYLLMAYIISGIRRSDVIKEHVDEATKVLLLTNDALKSEIEEKKRAEDIIEQKNIELAQALQQAEAAAKAKSMFLATMSHEIRTPLNGVLGMAELLKKTYLAAKQQDYLNTMVHSGQTLLNIVNDILDFSKIEAGELTLAEVNFNPNTIIDHSTRLYAKAAEDKGLQLIISPLTDLNTSVIGDADRLIQVMSNLVNNAVKFTDKGEIITSIHMFDETDESCRLRFTVTDTGIGISKEGQKELFSSFKQLESFATRKQSGTGLGLAISKQLVELMGGTMGVESAVGTGSSFWFEIVFKKGSESQSRTSFFDTSDKDFKAIIAEKNHTHGQILLKTLSRWKINCVLTDNALEAVARIRAQQTTDLILLDSQIAAENDYTLLRELQTLPESKQAKILIIVSEKELEIVDRCNAMKVDGFLSRPVRSSQLFDTIVTLLNINSSAYEPAPAADRMYVPMRKERILVVDDVAVNQMVVRGMLDQFGFDAQTANNGLVAVEMLEQSSFDLVFMDISMPVMDGYEATRAIREKYDEEGPVIIGLTAHALKEEHDAAIQAGMNEVLTKPVSADALKHSLDHWLPYLNPLADTPKLPTMNKEKNPIQTAGPKTAPQTDVLDQSVIERLQGELGPNLSIVIKAYLDELPARVSDLASALGQEDAALLAASAHRLKGSSRNIGANVLGNFCMDLERAAKEGALGAADDLISKISDEALKVDEALQALQDT